ncbi:LysM peptidoglycan-binding domain-containing protein [Furfurilactobacillus siliginis]|uniref:Peptidoglycan-binding protein n=1 Tax=Furfurilactobacillus siliginis TaxID=348151 RepID=A0A0R2L9A6_9LACO|nr:LysM domain-containing protein [Furfurilactobacillus siliginis]KRN96389.1 hypothetical protein IV55_GL001353 [Furfurilactobacillus siliginis]GEK29014.1 peptidoglycan-binding protein [Furfurilactobacillus siliginis]
MSNRHNKASKPFNMYKTSKQWLIASTFLTMGVIGSSAKADSWKANSVEQVKTALLHQKQPQSYIIQPGDTLWALSQATGISESALQQLNNMTNADLIITGNKLTVNANGSVSLANAQGHTQATVQPAAPISQPRAIISTPQSQAPAAASVAPVQSAAPVVTSVAPVQSQAASADSNGQSTADSLAAAQSEAANANSIALAQSQALTADSLALAQSQAATADSLATAQSQALTANSIAVAQSEAANANSIALASSQALVAQQSVAAATPAPAAQQPVQQAPVQQATPQPAPAPVAAPVQAAPQQPAQPASTTTADEAAKAWIANRESSNSYTATNGQYYGKYQLSLDKLHGDLSSANQENVATQYATSHYGSWANAQSFWQVNGWW